MGYRVIIELASPVIIDPLSSIDGIVAWCVMQELGIVKDYDKCFERLPIEKFRFGKGDWFYMASSWWLHEGAQYCQFETRIYKRFPFNRLGYYHGKEIRIDTSRGVDKAYSIPLYPMSVRNLNFQFEGNHKEVEKLLRKWLRGVGKKVSVGFGLVKSIDIEKDKGSSILFDDGSVRRPIPLEAARKIGVKTGTEIRAVAFYRPPYAPFNPERRKVCLVPSGSKQRGE